MMTGFRDDRKVVLLRAAYDILKRCDDGPYVENALSTLAQYDGTNCDGGCLMNDIMYELELDEDEPPLPLLDEEEI
jgi:hypothetical protein